MTIEEYKINIMINTIPTLEERLAKVNNAIVEFGLKGQGLSQEDWLSLKMELIDNYEHTGLSAYQVRNRIVNNLIEKRLEVLPMENKYFIKVETNDLNWNIYKETYKIIKEVDSNFFEVTKLDTYLYFKEKNRDIPKRYIVKLKRGTNNVFHSKKDKGSMFFLSDSPTSVYDYRVR